MKKQKRKLVYLVPTVVIAILVLVIISLIIFNPFSGEPVSPMKIVPFTGLPGLEQWPTFSQDGSQMAFSWKAENSDNYDIYVQVIGAGNATPFIENPEDDIEGRHSAFWMKTYTETILFFMVLFIVLVFLAAVR